MKKNLKDECISLPELPVKLILCFFPLMFFTICTMDFAEKKELFIV